MLSVSNEEILRTSVTVGVKRPLAKMFEGVIASLLNRCLGKYVEDLDLESLNVGIFSGNVVLENLKLKPEALVSTCEIR